MKFLDIKNFKNKKELRICGVPIYTVDFSYPEQKRTQSFLGGFITTDRTNDIYDYTGEKLLKIFNFSLLKRLDEGNKREYYFANKLIKTTYIFNKFKKYLKLINKEHDDVYLLNANSGEIYLFLTYFMDTYFKKNGSKNPILIATKKYHLDMIKMICPDIPAMLIKSSKFKIRENEFKFGNFRWFVIFPHEHFVKVEVNIKNNPASHYFKMMQERLQISDENLTYRKIQIPVEIEQSMLKKVSDINLNLEKFIFIAPEAYSCQSINFKYWIDLMKDYKAKGFDIFLNIMKDFNDYQGAEFKTCYLSYPEAFALAKHAKKIITLRSGLSEVLLQTNVPIDILYTKFKWRNTLGDMSIDGVISGFGLLNLPYIDKSKINEIKIEQIIKDNYVE